VLNTIIFNIVYVYSHFRRTVDHSKWLQRPLPALYLSYAAHDVYVIGIIYDHFFQKRYLVKSLPEQSARYISIWENDQPLKDDVYRRNPLLPLEILSTSSNQTKVRACSGCKRDLTLRSFEGNGTKCWVCMAVDESEGSKWERERFRRRF
jgi:exonuclease 3'-5' domain-containing protein 1